MRKTFWIFLAILLAPVTALAQEQLPYPPATPYQQWQAVQPIQPPVFVQPFGNGYAVGQIGQPQTLVQPFGNGWIVTSPPPVFIPIPTP